MKIILFNVFTKIGPKLHFFGIPKKRFENQHILTICSLCKSKPDINAKKLHNLPPYDFIYHRFISYRHQKVKKITLDSVRPEIRYFVRVQGRQKF